MMAVVAKYVGAVLLFVAAYWTLLFFMQRRMMFPAYFTWGTGSVPPRDATQVWLDHDAGKTEAWFLPALHTNDSPPPLLIFAHGNAELIDHWPDAFDEPRRWGMAVLLVEYPGYGRSTGSPSEASIGVSFRAAYDWALAHTAIDPDRIVGYGRSVGGGAIAGLSRNRRFAAMILESTFTSTRPFARRYGAPKFLVRDPFDNEAAVAAFEGPLMVIHGAHDEIIPTRHGRALARVGGVELHELPCGHNDCPRSWERIQEFLEGAGITQAGTGQ